MGCASHCKCRVSALYLIISYPPATSFLHCLKPVARMIGLKVVNIRYRSIGDIGALCSPKSHQKNCQRTNENYLFMCVNSQKNSSTMATSCNCKNQYVRIEKRSACTCKIKGFICTSLYKCGTGKFLCKK